MDIFFYKSLGLGDFNLLNNETGLDLEVSASPSVSSEHELLMTLVTVDLQDSVIILSDILIIPLHQLFVAIKILWFIYSLFKKYPCREII